MLRTAKPVDVSLSLQDGAIRVPGYTAGGWATRLYAESGFFPGDQPISTFTEEQLHQFLHADPTKVRINGINMTYEGLVPKVRASILSKDPDALQPHLRAFVERAVRFTTCPKCQGTRLNEGARSSLIDETSIADASMMQVTDLAAWVAGLQLPGVEPLLANLRRTLDSMVAVGLGYLSLNRATGSLSGGEAQRVRLVRHLGSSLTDVMYVFDEPTVGLHLADVEQLLGLLDRLVDEGTSVIVVEHHQAVMAHADWIIDMGPGAGSEGGRVVFEGTPADLVDGRCTVTGQYLAEYVAAA